MHAQITVPGSCARLGLARAHNICAQRLSRRQLSACGRRPRSVGSKSGGSVEERDDDARDGSAGASSSASADGAADSRSQPLGEQSDADWRSFRARLIETENSSQRGRGGDDAAGQSLQENAEVQWAHQLANPEQGCILVAKRGDMEMFSNTVILITEHSDKRGSVGIILNLPLPMPVSDVATELPIKGVFGTQRLFYGGPLRNNSLFAVHTHAGLQKSLEVLPGVWCGGLADAVERVLGGTLPLKGFRLVSGTSGWGPYQLSNEILEGCWFVVAASNTVVQDMLRVETCPEDASAPVRDRMWQQLLDLAQLTLP